jgi:hypothetical protein
MGRTLPDGRPVPPTAPDADILDDADLRGIRDALREGKKVGLSADGKIHVFPTPEGDPIDLPSETFIESKLGEVRSLLQHGFNATLHPSGEINANSHDGKFNYQADETVGLTDTDRSTIRRMIVGGAEVGITPDGTIQYSQRLGVATRSLNQADRVMAELDRQISSGQLATEAAAGRGLTISGRDDGGMEFGYQDAPRIAGFALPEDGLPADRVDDLLADPTGRALAQQAQSMDARAEQLRTAALGYHQSESGRLGVERDDAVRRQNMAQQGAAQATQQFDDARVAAGEEWDTARRLELEAHAAQQQGDTARAEDLLDQADLHRSQEAVQRQRSDAAFAERQRLTEDAQEQMGRQRTADFELRTVARESAAQVHWAQDLDERADLVQQAAAAAAAGDQQRAADLADQSLIELVDEPDDYVGNLTTGQAARPAAPPAPAAPPPLPNPEHEGRGGPFGPINPGPFGAIDSAPDQGGDVVAAIDAPDAPAAFDPDPAPDLGPQPDPEPEPEPESDAVAGVDATDGSLDA